MSILEIAKLAGVSHATVSRVINNDPSVSPETAIKVRSIMKKTGYVPKSPSLRRGPKRAKDTYFKTGNIAFLSSSQNLKILTHSPVMQNVVHGIEEELIAQGMSMVQGAINANRPLPPIVSKGDVDGIIVWPNLDSLPDDMVETLRNRPVVYVMSAEEFRLPGDRVKNNNAAVGRLAAEYLLSRGHETIAHIIPASFANPDRMQSRWNAFSAMAERASKQAIQLKVNESEADWLEIDPEREKLIEAKLQDLMQSSPRPTGLFTTFDALAAKIYPMLRKLGVEIGKDVEVVSCNNEISLLAGLDPRPKSIDIQPELIGKRAVEQLRWRIRNPEDTSLITVQIEPQLI
ncbi:LacI family DNA-binding transcriptional regulator [Candidatus Sumerlaeota bacterium]|nr:LacI family DNA-binding transcriptional regulator [Candidatus Sumerlaeota bacterium]